MAHFKVKATHEGNFKFCGREFSQAEDFSVTVTCKTHAESLLLVTYVKNGRSYDDTATESEVCQLRSAIGRLAWIAPQCRIDFGYTCSRLQSVASTARIEHLDVADALQRGNEHHGRGSLPRGALDFNEAIMVTLSDATWEAVLAQSGHNLSASGAAVVVMESQRTGDAD